MLRKLFLVLLFSISTAHAAQNAGMLPYAYKDGKAYFLFGLENRYWDSGSWTKPGISKWVWSDFGGKCDSVDATDAPKYGTDQATLCAVREGTEETRYVFGNQLPLKSGLTNSSLEYNNSVIYLKNRVSSKFIVDTAYEEFFINVDYIDAQKFNSSPKVPSDEKQEWRWIFVEDVLEALKNQDANGFSRFNFPHTKTNKIFPPLAATLRRTDVQNFIKTTILPGQTAAPKKLQELVSSITTLTHELTQLMQQLQALG